MPLKPDDLAEVLAKIQAGAKAADLESDELDFKRQPDSLPDAIKQIVEAAVCFANGQGGTIVVGIADAVEGPPAFLGCTLDPPTIQRRVHELTEPSLTVGVRKEEHHGVVLLVIDVLQSYEIHADLKGRSTRRIGTDCFPILPQDHRRLQEERLGVDWSAQPSGRPAADVVPAALALARDALSRIPDDRSALARLSDEDLLRALGVVTETGELLRAGEVLFCEALGDEAAILYQYRRTPGGEATAVERLQPPLTIAFESAMQLVWARRNVTPLTLPNGEQLEISDFPEVAVREALSNAVLHRDYRLSGPVNIEHSPMSFVVISPGPLVGSVTAENILTHASSPRNPVLAAAARQLRLAEETGRGVDRMFREMIRLGHELPTIEDQIDFVRVVLAGGAPRASIVRFVAQLPAEEREDTDAMLVLFTLCTRRVVTANEIALVLQKPPAESESILRRLAQDRPGMLEPTRKTVRNRTPEYRLRGDALRALGAAVRYQRRTTDEIDRKVTAHLHEYGKVTNRTLQNLFDIDLWRARDILADLQSREMIVRTSTASRGPGVEYGPGPKLPKKRIRRSSKASAVEEVAEDLTLFGTGYPDRR